MRDTTAPKIRLTGLLASERDITRDQRRSRRKHRCKPYTVNCRRIARRDLDRGRQLYPETGYWKPLTRADCSQIPRPCPYVSCAHHLYLDVKDNGNIQLNFPDLEPHDLEHSCALDVAERGGLILEHVSGLLNLTRERLRQIHDIAMAKVKEELATTRLGRELLSCSEKIPTFLPDEVSELGRVYRSFEEIPVQCQAGRHSYPTDKAHYLA